MFYNRKPECLPVAFTGEGKYPSNTEVVYALRPI
jgi:hypothetical protein